MWSVLIRELRVESRRPLTHWLRVGAGVALLVGCLLATGMEFVGGAAFGGSVGSAIFRVIDGTVLLAIILVVPLLTADCINREVRDGTLGLLLLTALTSRAIVVAKVAAQAIRAFSVYLTALPFVAIPLLLGGIHWENLAFAATVDFAVLLLALAAGLIASTIIRQRAGAAIFALALSFFLAFLWMGFHQLLMFLYLGRRLGTNSVPAFILGAWDEDLLLSLARLFQSNLDFSEIAFWGGPGQATISISSPTALVGMQWVSRLVGMLAASLTFLIITISFVASRLNKTAKSDPLPSWMLSLRKIFCEPRYWRLLFQRKMTRSLNRNPIGWLQQYTWHARCGKWALCMLVILVQSFAAANNAAWSLVQPSLGLTVLIGAALVSCNSFRLERENGAMELLLVSPLSPAQIIFGRLRGCWMQLLPAVLVVILACLIVSYPWIELSRPQFSELRASLWLFLGGAVAVPIIGLYLSMSRLPAVGSFALTLIVGLAIPWL
jgi:ABC-type transport system involved in multi-copper enzyme maturation permease subunit